MHIEIRPLGESDLRAAERIFRLAFGTFLGMPEPSAFMGDADLTTNRRHAAPAAALGAYAGETLLGSNFATRWGSFGFLGPLTVHPDHWGNGIGKRLMAATMDLFEEWGTRQVGLFTFPESALHIGLYRAFGFSPQALTPVLSRPVVAPPTGLAWTTLSKADASARSALIAAARDLTDEVSSGLDVTAEIMAVANQGLGDTVFIHDGSELTGLAVCHAGAGSEAGSGTVYVKFGAVRSGDGAPAAFARLLDACEALAGDRGAAQLVAGVNSARADAHRLLQAKGFRVFLTGLAMQRPDTPGHNRADRFVIDDWR